MKKRRAAGPGEKAAASRSAEKDSAQIWCDTELGQLCRAIDELEPAKLKTSSETQVRAAALSPRSWL